MLELALLARARHKDREHLHLPPSPCGRVFVTQFPLQCRGRETNDEDDTHEMPFVRTHRVALFRVHSGTTLPADPDHRALSESPWVMSCLTLPLQGHPMGTSMLTAASSTTPSSLKTATLRKKFGSPHRFADAPGRIGHSL